MLLGLKLCFKSSPIMIKVVTLWVVCFLPYSSHPVRGENQIKTCIVYREEDDGDNFIESEIGVEGEINVDRLFLLIRVFWDKNSDYIINVRIYEVNQTPYLIPKSVNILNLLKTRRK